MSSKTKVDRQTQIAVYAAYDEGILQTSDELAVWQMAYLFENHPIRNR